MIIMIPHPHEEKPHPEGRASDGPWLHLLSKEREGRKREYFNQTRMVNIPNNAHLVAKVI